MWVYNPWKLLLHCNKCQSFFALNVIFLYIYESHLKRKEINISGVVVGKLVSDVVVDDNVDGGGIYALSGVVDDGDGGVVYSLSTLLSMAARMTSGIEVGINVVVGVVDVVVKHQQLVTKNSCCRKNIRFFNEYFGHGFESQHSQSFCS